MEKELGVDIIVKQTKFVMQTLCVLADLLINISHCADTITIPAT